MSNAVIEILIYLAAAVVCVPLASWLGLGSVLGYLVAGAIIGPWVTGLVHEPETIMHFAELGVVMMLFMIGLELDLKRLWGIRRQVFGGGTLQLLVCGVGLALGLLAAGLEWQGALVAGLALALSSTAIAVQTMAEKHLERTPMGQAAFAVLLFQDIAAIPLVALVPLLGASEAAAGAHADGGDGLLGVAKALGAIVGVVALGRYLTRPILRILAKTGVREVFTAFALLLVLGIAALMTLAGLSMGLGAFLAGVLLASSEYRHALESDLAPFKGLLMGLFFIAVGMAIDFGLVVREPLLVTALVLGFVVVKTLLIRVIARRLGVTTTERWRFAFLLSQGGEFAFVIFGIASKAKLLPGDWDARLTLVVALSMAATPLMLLIQERLAARTPARERESDVADEGAPVIIAGFGRFGQIVARLLWASGVKATVLDHDPEQIELLQRFGFRVFYGDATRLDLLETAGAARARILVIAIDGIQESLELVDRVRAHFPHLELVVRARNVSHYVELRKRKVTLVDRETFDAALASGRRTLEALGCPPYEARERADRFRQHNIAMLESLFAAWDDETRRVSLAKAARQELAEQFEKDRQALEHHGVTGWHPDAAPLAHRDEVT